MGRLLAKLTAREDSGPAATLATFAPERARKVAESRKSQGRDPAGKKDQGARLLAVIRAEGLPDSTIGRSDCTPEELAELTDDQLIGLAHMLADDAYRYAGRPAPGDTAAVLCKGCGPVLLSPILVANIPHTREGWPIIGGCPWCFVRKRGVRIPRPPVTCAGCVHRVPDSINRDGGMGRCAVRPDTWRFPCQKHTCQDWRPPEC